MINLPRNFVIGDIHGRVDALYHVLKDSKFDVDNDFLVILGDVVDGGFYTKQCIDLLLTVKNRVLILGNHDWWCLEWFKGGVELPVWYHQGGSSTILSYGHDYKLVPKSHIEFLESAQPYYIDTMNRVFVHGGFDPNMPLHVQSLHDLMWDRSLINIAKGYYDVDKKVEVPGIKIPRYEMVFVGHTTTQLYGSEIPRKFNNLIMMDTGAGWNGRLTMMDVDTFRYYQSDRMIPANEEEYDFDIAYNDWSVL